MSLFQKQPSERFPISMDFTDWLAVGETIATIRSVTATKGETDVTEEIIDGSSIDGNKIKTVVKSGDSGSQYKITFEITTSDDNDYEDDVLMLVKDK